MKNMPVFFYFISIFVIFSAFDCYGRTYNNTTGSSHKTNESNKRVDAPISLFESQGDTIEISSTINLNGRTITIPKNHTLLFKNGQIKNGHVIFQNTRLDGKVKIQCAFEGTVSNDSIYVDWFFRGAAKVHRLSNASKSIQSVFDLGAKHVFFGKGFYQFNNVRIGNDIEVIGNETVIIPEVLEQKKYNFNFLKNIFYACNADTVVIRGVSFVGATTPTILPSFKSTELYGEPLIWVDNAKKVVIDRCVFRDIENCTYCNKAYNYYGKKQGSCVCLWDVNDASYINCEQVNCRHDEQVWIIAVNKPIMETKVYYSGNYVHDMTPGPNSSAFTCVTGTCLVENNKVERYSYPGSMFNIFAKRAIIRKNDIENCYCSSVFDMCEYNYFHNDDISIEDNIVDAVNSILVLGQSDKVKIRNNRFRGLGVYSSANNRVPQKTTGRYPYWYSDEGVVLPTDTETVIEGNICDFTAYDGSRSIAGTKADYSTGLIIEPQKYNNVGANYGCGILIHPNDAKAGLVCIINNIFSSIQSLEGVVDKNNLAGTYPYTIKMMNTENAVIRGNTFNGYYPLFQDPNEYTCIGIYNYPDEMEKMEKSTEICQKPSMYGKYVIEDNMFNVPEGTAFYPVSFNPRVNSYRQTVLTISELVVRNNRFGVANSKVIETRKWSERAAYKFNGLVKVLNEIVQ